MKLGSIRFEAKYMAIQYFYEHKAWSIRWMCKQLNITRAAYYKWLKHETPKHELENIELVQLIQQYDEKYDHILGYRRMTTWINRFEGKQYGKNRVYRIMKMLNIHSVIRKKKRKYHSVTPENIAENILNRDFYADAPNKKWVTDVTEFRWYEGPIIHKLYLSAILDLYDRSIVSWAVSKRNDNKLVFDTFEQAVAANPEAKPIFHSDRGFQYTSKSFQARLRTQEITQSMSRVGHCIDNGPMEGFWGTIKSEMYYLNKFSDETSLRKAIDEYIIFYNTRRPQERFAFQTPLEVRNNALHTDVLARYPIAVNKRIEKYKARYTE